MSLLLLVGIRGGSNGGLLMGNMLVRRPDLFGAVCCAVPLLDMRAYHTLLAGASWMAEYGNPDVPDVSMCVCGLLGRFTTITGCLDRLCKTL